jgi:hypothetical protein
VSLPLIHTSINELQHHTNAPALDLLALSTSRCMSVLPPCRQVAMHTEYYTRPRLQRHVIRILWMVPIYSLDAWFALRFKDAQGYLDPIREIYEAYVIYNFYAYLMNYLEDELGMPDEHLAKKAQIQHIWPFNYCLAPWKMGQEFIWETKKVSPSADVQAAVRRQRVRLYVRSLSSRSSIHPLHFMHLLVVHSSLV